MLVDKKTGEIFIYAPIGADFFGEGITADAFILALDSLGGKRATVRINSPGGDAFQGIAIYNAMKRYAGGVDVVVDALAASAASIIAMGGETRTTLTGAMWMLHKAMTFAFGNDDDVQKSLNMLKAGDSSIVSIYKQAMNKSDAEIMDIMRAETWYTAEESLAVGLSTAKSAEAASKPTMANWFKNAPASIYNTTENVKPKVFVHRQAAHLLTNLH